MEAACAGVRSTVLTLAHETCGPITCIILYGIVIA
jgi:hypothetical protein